MAKINIDKLSLEIVKQLDLYKNVTVEIMENAVKKTAKKTAKTISQNADSAFGGTGKYAKSWSYKKDGSLRGKWAYSMVVYAKAPYYRLAHLLEKPHLKRDGTRWQGRPHIEPAEKVAEDILVNEIVSGIVGEDTL